MITCSVKIFRAAPTPAGMIEKATSASTTSDTVAGSDPNLCLVYLTPASVPGGGGIVGFYMTKDVK